MSLKPNRDLLNPNFEGYKLAERTLPCITQPFQGGVFKVVPPEDKFSYQFVREATMHNHLVTDPWNGFRVYWVTNQPPHKILCGFVLNTTSEVVISAVYQFEVPSISSFNSTLPDTNPSLHFLSPTISLFYHSSITKGHLLLFHTSRGHGSTSEAVPPPWSIIASISLASPNVTVQSASLRDGGELHFMTFDLQESATDKSVDCVWWKVDFSCSLDSSGPEIITDVDRTPCYSWKTSTIPLHSQFAGQSLVIITESAIEGRSSGEGKSRTQTEEDESAPVRGIGYQDELERKYTWVQTDSGLTVNVALPEDVGKRDIVCDIKQDSLVVGLTDGTSYIRGELWGHIDVDVSTWTFAKGSLEIDLEKLQANQKWKSLLNDGSGNSTGQLPLQEGLDYDGLPAQELEEIEKRIKDATKGKRETTGNETKNSKPIIVQTAYEECDNDDESDISIYTITQNGTIAQKIGLGGRQLLFTFPLISIKHDIDALVFNTSSSPDGSISFDHMGTFNALGYVQASKREKKFITCSSDCLYAALCHSSRHIFVYCQPSEKGKGQTALQYVHTLSKTETILGMQLSNEKLVYVLFESELVVLKLHH